MTKGEWVAWSSCKPALWAEYLQLLHELDDELPPLARNALVGCLLTEGLRGAQHGGRGAIDAP